MNKRTYLLLIILVFLKLNFGFSQKKDVDINSLSLQQLVQINNNFMLNDSFVQSLPSGKRLVQMDSLNSNFNFRYGFALMQTSSFLEIPLPYIEKSNTFVKKEADLIGFNEKYAPFDAIYFNAVANHRIGNIDRAIDLYTNFLSKVNDKNKLYSLAKLGLKQAQNAKSLDPNKNVIYVQPVDIINSEFSEYSPIITSDENALYFTSKRPWEDGLSFLNPITNKYFEDIYISYINKDSTFSPPQRLDFCRRDVNEASISFRLDERTVYTYTSETGNGDIYYMDFFKNAYKAPALLNIKNVNDNKFQPHFYISADNKTAFFSSENQKDGYGGLDIYMMKRVGLDGWSEPENLGPVINSQYDEDSPFLTFDNKYLYFASNNDKSIGGYDIFRSEWKDGQFSTPENLGYPINSTYNDTYYTTTANGRTAYFSSFRKGGKGEMDIYKVLYHKIQSEASILEGKVYFTNDSEKIPDYIVVRVKCMDCDEDYIVYPRMRDGIFMAGLNKCKNYELTYIDTINKNDIAVQHLKTNCIDEYEVIHKELGIERKNGLLVENIQYVLLGQIVDNISQKGIPNIQLTLKDNKGKELATLASDKDGKFTTSIIEGLQKGKEYTLSIDIADDSKKYINIIKNITIKTDDDRLIDLGQTGLELNKLGNDLAKAAELNTIYYDLNSSYIRPDARIELNKIVSAMNQNPTMKIELRSHTDCRESEEYNIWLSNRRAKRAENYIKARISKGSQRIVGKGYGESQLVNECVCGDTGDTSGCTEEQHQQNRRTEFIIVSDLNKGQKVVDLEK